MALKCKVEVGDMQIKNLIAKFNGSPKQVKPKPKPKAKSMNSLSRLDKIATARQKESENRYPKKEVSK